jgi:hypothetical protein
VIEYFTFVGVANGGPSPMDQTIFSNDITNFLLEISFAADSSHMEGLARISPDINWTTHGQSVLNLLAGAVESTIVNAFHATHCVFTAVCD